MNSAKNFAEDAIDSIKSFFGYGEKPFIPTGTHQNKSAPSDTNIGPDKDPKCQPTSVKEINLLDEIQLNTTEWKCIDKILRNVTNNPVNFTNLLLTATNETVVFQIKNCYPDKSDNGTDWFGWWQPQEWWNTLIQPKEWLSNFINSDWWIKFSQTDFWKFVTDHYWYVIIAVVAIIVVFTCLCKLCCVLCKKRNDEDLLE